MTQTSSTLRKSTLHPLGPTVVVSGFVGTYSAGQVVNRLLSVVSSHVVVESKETVNW